MAILGIPIIVGQLGTIIQGLADTIMVGHFSAHSLAAAGFVNNIMVLVLIFALGYSYAITPVIGPMHARGEFENAGKALKAGLQVNGALGMVLFLLMGTDMLLSFDSWREPDEIFRLCWPVYIRREADAALDGEIIRRIARYRAEYGKTVCRVDAPALEVSSTEIRQAVAAGRSIDDMVPPAVAAYIREKNLYREGDGTHGNDRGE